MVQRITNITIHMAHNDMFKHFSVGIWNSQSEQNSEITNETRNQVEDQPLDLVAARNCDSFVTCSCNLDN